MENPPLRPLHLNSVLSRAKLNHYARLTTEGIDTFTSARTNRRSQSTSRWDRDRWSPQDRRAA